MKQSKKIKALIISIILFLCVGSLLPTTNVNADTSENAETTTFVISDSNKSYSSYNDSKIVVIPGNPLFKGVYNFVKNKFGGQTSIPKKLLKDSNHVDLKKFNKKDHKGERKGPKNWTISKDTSNHGGSKWKLKDSHGKRVASLSGNGKILRR